MFPRIFLKRFSGYYVERAPDTWPDAVDLFAICLFLAAVIVLPLTGYWLTVLDIRAYMRALRGVLVRITSRSVRCRSGLIKAHHRVSERWGLNGPARKRM